ncbi:unnamed protein product [Lupinus luteus]|uniref:Uncharacterized protein n=1 Tax=Lupinus luteus TaxID=3873 RepID=A0AAV1YF38_LUPLU
MGDESIMVTPNQVAGQLRVNRKNNIGKEWMVVLNKFLERQALDSEFFMPLRLMKIMFVVVYFGPMVEQEMHT